MLVLRQLFFTFRRSYSMKYFWCIIFFLPFLVKAQLVTTAQGAASLVQNTLLGPGVQVSNIQFSGASGAIGKFTANGTNLGINSGIIITTGAISGGGGPQGPNNQSNAGVDNNYPGYSALSNLVGGTSTYNASILEFDFIPFADTVRFRYVFGSEEYPEYVGSQFNDVFAFFISGPGISGNQNIAKLPNGVPVAINNVNNGNPGGTSSGIGPQPASNPAYYVYNGTGNNSPYNSSTTYIQYDGFTKVLEAYSKVQCGKKYHLTIAIADVGDGIFDSGIFLEANSLTSKAPVQITYQMSQDVFGDGISMAEGCVSTTVKLKRTSEINQALTIPITVTGTATQGVDYSSIPTSVTFSPGQTEIQFTFNAFADAITEGAETISIEFATLDACDNPSPFFIDLQIKDIEPVSVTVNSVDKACPQDDAVLTAVPAGGTGPYTILWSTNETTESITVNPPATQTYTVSVTDNCLHQTASATATVTVPIFAPITLTTTNDITEICPYVPKVLKVTATGGSGNYQYQWYLQDSPLISISSLDSVTVKPNKTTMYYVRVTDNCGTYTIDSVLYTITSPPLVLTMTPERLICPNDTTIIGVTATGGYGQYFYQWIQTNETTPQIAVHPSETTTYTVSVSDECQTFTVEGSTLVKVIHPIADFRIASSVLFNGMPIAFQNLSTGAVTYQWDFGDGTRSNLTHPTNTYDSVGTYTIELIATNEIGCKDSTFQKITIYEEFWIYVPNTFTPDGNQFNSTFKASMINIKEVQVSIFDRWGLELFRSTDLNWEWDGTYKDLLVPDGTYTYKIKFIATNGYEDTLVGHVNILK